MNINGLYQQPWVCHYNRNCICLFVWWCLTSGMGKKHYTISNGLVWFGSMVLDATFNNISGISWRSVLLVEEPIVPGENHRPVASHWQTLSHNVVYLALSGIRIHNISWNFFLLKIWRKILIFQVQAIIIWFLYQSQ